MANLIRGLSENGGVVFCGVDSTDIVCKAEKLHTTSATCSAALGRLLTGATLMAPCSRMTATASPCVWRAAALPACSLPAPTAPAT